MTVPKRVATTLIAAEIERMGKRDRAKELRTRTQEIDDQLQSLYRERRAVQAELDAIIEKAFNTVKGRGDFE